MSKNATLKRVAGSKDVVHFEIHAPGVAAALTRAEGEPSAALTERLDRALGSNEWHIHKCEGRWRVSLRCKVPAAPRQQAEPAPQTQRTACPRCKGTGMYPTQRANGVCFHCKGKGWQSSIDKRRNATYQMHHKAKAASRKNADLRNAETARADALLGQC